MDKLAVKTNSSEIAKTKPQENGEDSGTTTKSSKKKPKKEDKWKQKMMFLYEDGADAEEEVAESANTETEAVADSRYM